MKTSIVVIGLAPQGLFLLRELSRAGFDVHVVAASKSPGFYSRYGTKYIAKDEEELVDRLTSLSRCLGFRARCYISSGAMLECVLKHIPETYDLFEVFPRPFEAVARLSDKLKTYELAANCGIPLLPTLTTEQDEQVRRNLSSGHDLIAKWNCEVDNFGQRAFKTRILESPADYDAVLDVVPVHEQKHLLLQLMVDSAQDRNVAHLGYYVDGECRAEYLAQQLRQYPQGITSYAQEYTGRNAVVLVEQARALFRTVRYTGFGEAEFKFDKDYETGFLLEVNPRTCGWSSALKGRYSDLERLFLQPNSDCELKVASERTAWSNTLRDLVAIAYYAKKTRSVGSIFRGIASHMRVRSGDVFDTGDIKPFFAELTSLLRK